MLQRLPRRRVVVRFDFRAFPARCRGYRTCWLILERSGCDVCLRDPGYEVDIWVDADLGSMARVWLGDLSFAEAVRAKKIRVAGTPALVRDFPAWLLLSHFASVPRPPSLYPAEGVTHREKR